MSTQSFNSFFWAFVMSIFFLRLLNGDEIPHGIPQPIWESLDPINEAVPTPPQNWFSEPIEGFYYIDNNHPNATDNNNLYGYPDKPRVSIPEVPLTAGSYVEIKGGPYEVTGGDKEIDIIFEGTSDRLCWVVGKGSTRPELLGDVSISGSYGVVENISFRRNNATSKDPKVKVGNSDGSGQYSANHICIRECDIIGDGTFRQGFSAAISIKGFEDNETNNIIIYDCEIKNLGDVQYSIDQDEDDDHGIIPRQYTNNIWILDNSIHHCAGDGIQVSGNNSFGEARSQFVYIGNNEIHTCGENAIDIKSSVDVIISGNKFHNYVDSAGSDGTAVVIQQEGGEGCERIWILFNEIYNSSLAVRAEETITECFVLGNVLYDLKGTYSSIYVRTNNANLSLIDNTIARYENVAFRWDNIPDIEFFGNALLSRINSSGYEIRGSSPISGATVNRNIYDNSVGFRARDYSGTHNSFDSWKTGNNGGWDQDSIYGPLECTNPSLDDFSLKESSAAIGAGEKHPAYDRFNLLYGLNIQYDFAGNPRPQGGSWDIGAFEYMASGGGSLPLPPENLRIVD